MPHPPSSPADARHETRATDVRHTERVSSDGTFHLEMDSHPDDTQTVSLTGELDMDDANWVEATLASAADHHRRMTIDLSALEFIDSTGLRALIALRQRATVRQMAISFENPSSAVLRPLKAAGLHASFD